jgi:hypothetical protein
MIEKILEGDQNYDWILKKMKKSIPNIKIESIIMIKNDYLWRIFKNTEDELM